MSSLFARCCVTASLCLAAFGAPLADGVPLELRQAARDGDVQSLFLMGRLYAEGEGELRRDPAEAARWWRQAAAAGHTGAQRELALLHLSGRGVPQSFTEATRLFFLAANKGDIDSQFELGTLLISGRGGQMSVDTGMEWLVRAADGGHHPAQLSLARAYLAAERSDPAHAEGVGWLRRAVDAGYTPAIYYLATLYADATLIPESPDEAASLFERAASTGHPDAQVWMGRHLQRADPPDHIAALAQYRLAAAQGNADGHYGVARIHLDRLVRTPNTQEGLRHLYAAADLGHAEAHYSLGGMYGRGALPGGGDRAVSHFERAAHLNHTGAMYELALAHYQGTGPLRRNPAAAAEWWRRAAQRGHVESQYAFALLHLSGAGVPRNPGVAFALANVAAAQGHHEGGALRDELMTSLDPDVLRQAQELSLTLFQQYVSDRGRHLEGQLK